ncbi:MAG TPA: OsmC family protein [Flavobacteriaceae bacterium]|nr:OsmC family protein [Flavobacteriaceae bacterium]
MAKITSSIKQELYKVEIKSPTGNVVIADEPVDKGGKDLGFSPKELLASALATCTSATVKMYADRKEWDLEEVQLEIALERDEKENKTIINRKIDFVGNLDDDQKSRLLKVANTCPIHKILSNPIEINTEVVK